MYRNIEYKNVIPDKSTIIVGLSGGPDSVFLLHFLISLRDQKNLTLIAAHLDHGWRKDSANDAQFCKELTHSLSVQFENATLQELKLTFKFNGSKEEIGRKARRAFFESLVQKYNANAIALAHHFDDQEETFFIRLIRGASLSGLTGMKAKEGLYIRPLLALRKAEILSYLDEHKIPYLTDPSNESPEFLRNRIRNTAIPALRACDDRFDNNFESTLENLQQTEEFLQQFAQKKLNEITTNQSLIIEQLLVLHPILRNKIIIAWLIENKVPFTPSAGLIDEIVRFLQQSGDGQHIFYGKWKIHKQDGKATIISC